MQNVPFHDEDCLYQASEPILLTQWNMKRIPSVTGIMCPKCVKQNMYVIGLIFLSVLKATKYTRLYPATTYCTRRPGLKERIAQENVEIFLFLIVIFSYVSLLYYPNFNL